MFLWHLLRHWCGISNVQVVPSSGCEGIIILTFQNIQIWNWSVTRPIRLYSKTDKHTCIYSNEMLRVYVQTIFHYESVILSQSLRNTITKSTIIIRMYFMNRIKLINIIQIKVICWYNHKTDSSLLISVYFTELWLYVHRVEMKICQILVISKWIFDKWPNLDFMYAWKVFYICCVINLRDAEVLRRHSLHGENSSLGFIVLAHQWKLTLPLHGRLLAHKRNSIFKCKQHTIHDPNGLHSVSLADFITLFLCI